MRPMPARKRQRPGPRHREAPGPLASREPIRVRCRRPSHVLLTPLESTNPGEETLEPSVRGLLDRFAACDCRAGGYNFVRLADLRDACEAWTREEFDRVLL